MTTKKIAVPAYVRDPRQPGEAFISEEAARGDPALCFAIVQAEVAAAVEAVDRLEALTAFFAGSAS